MYNQRTETIPPIISVWAFLIVFWPLGDILRKWGGLNQIVYVLQMLVPVMAIFFLLIRNSWSPRSSIFFPACFIFLITGLAGTYYSISTFSSSYIFAWALGLSTLLGPPLLLCTLKQKSPSSSLLINRMAYTLIILVSILFLTNNLLSIVQSVVGRDHILSVGAGGALDAQIRTNTEIELRAPGFFTFINGNVLFSCISLLFLMASLSKPNVGPYAKLIRSVAFLSFPLTLVRSISRLYLFQSLIVSTPFIGLFFNYRSSIVYLAFIVFCFIALFYIPNLQHIFHDGLYNFSQRIDDSGGISEGIIMRFFNTLFFDAGGGSETLFANIFPWILYDPLASFFGYGVGFSSPLHRFLSNYEDTSYGYIFLDGRSFLIGENFFSSLLADIGIIGFALYVLFLFNSILLFLRKFSLMPILSSKAYVYASFVLLLLAFTAPYSRPANSMSFTLVVLTPFVCEMLFSPRQSLDTKR